METIKSWFLEAGASFAASVLRAVIIVVIGYLAVRILLKIMETAMRKSRLEKVANSLILSLVRVVCYVIIGLVAASALGLDMTSLVALASVLTLSVSLALQNMLANIIGGFTLIYTHPFHSGDYVQIGEDSGTVTEIDINYTRLATPDNKIISIPNSTVIAAQIINYSTTGTRRVDIPISASYDSPVQLVLDTLLEMADRPEILHEPAAPISIVNSYGDNAINYTLRFWVKSADYWTTTFAINREMKHVFDAKGIEMTYPHMNVHVVDIPKK